MRCCRGLPGVQPGDFPLGLGAVAGVPIELKLLQTSWQLDQEIDCAKAFAKVGGNH